MELVSHWLDQKDDD
ncbi:MAG: hypothetical protein GX180_11430 [Enterococcus sp.]|nr:hypothetical protein [Ignavibacteriota bacterium]NLM67763.1 hypothetical protein [Enterococcus sp.]